MSLDGRELEPLRCRLIGSRDYPVIMAYVMLSGFLLVVGNFIADLLYAFVDPRIKRGGASGGK